jgi:ABC-type Co2+ transport system permease subunit
MQLDRRLDRFTPQGARTLLPVAVGSSAVAIGLVHWLPEPAMLVVAATFAGVATAAVNVLIWSWLASGEPDPDDADQDEDDG